MCCYCDYSISTLSLLLFCNLINARYYLEDFTHIYPLHNVFTCLNNKISNKDSIKNLLCCESLFSFLFNQPRALEKQRRDNLLSDRLEIEGLGIYFAKEPHHPQFTNSPMYIEVINFCGSQPCSTSRGQRYYGLIELGPRTSGRKIFKILQRPIVDEEWILRCPILHEALMPCHTLASGS